MPLEVLLGLAADDVLDPPAIALDTPDHTASTTAPAPSSTPAMVVMPAPARVTGRGRGGALAPASARRPRVAAPGRYARPSLTSPRAKMLATKVSTSVAHPSPSPDWLMSRPFTTSSFSCASLRTPRG